MENIAALALALLLDLAWGEPPVWLHPVVWLGRFISIEERLAPRSGAKRQFLYGLVITLLDIALLALPVYVLLRYLRAWPILYIIIGALWLKVAFSVRALRQAALDIRSLLEAGRMDEARYRLRSLVGRDISQLDKPHLASAAVESVAENTSDSFVAPLFYFLLLGIPGALAYRAANTLDAMIGHRGQYEYLGKFAARLDDVLNYLPARLTALLLVAATFIRRKDGGGAWRVLYQDHALTASPNAGWPMSAMAGALGVELEKMGHYRLGAGLASPEPARIGLAVQLMQTAVGLWVVLCLALGVLRFVYIT